MRQHKSMAATRRLAVIALWGVTSVAVAPLPALAADGDGGAGGLGSAGQAGGGTVGAGGVGPLNGGHGGNGTTLGSGGGGGGGGATGSNGGKGGDSFGGASGGVVGGPGNSSAVNNSGAGGGGGGNGGGVQMTDIAPAANFTLNGGVTGSNGGNGGAGGNATGTASDGGGGGGGGGGGTYFSLSNKGNIIVNGTMVGGNGGDSGAGGAGTRNGGNGGNGGVGGSSLVVTGGNTLTNNGNLTGGSGGAGGTGGAGGSNNGTAGVGGAGGAGLTANGLGISIVNNGLIAGGLGNGGTGARANAINFTGGFNDLTLQNGWQLIGGIGVTGSLAFDQPATVNLSNVISGTGSVTQSGVGTLILSGVNTYTGTTTVASNTLQVDGSIASSSGVTVAAGRLTGAGIVSSTNVLGTFAPGTPGAPGTFMTVVGNLTMQPNSLYAVSLNPSASTYAVVTGTATLSGIVNASFAPGGYLTRQYDILRSAGLGGTTFVGLGTAGLPSGFTANLSYSTTDVFLNLTSVLSQSLANGGLNVNQKNVATGLNNFFNGGGTLTPNFTTIFGLTGNNLANALTQLSGEVATDAQSVAFQLTNQFLNTMLDPFVDGRSGGMTGGTRAFAPEQEARLPPDIALAYGQVLKASPKTATLDQRWSIWGSAYGGSNTTRGNAVLGSNDFSAQTYGFASGLDYRLTPDTVVGVALAGGGGKWNLAQGLGGGRSDAFQAGVYGSTRSGPAYIAAALSFTNNWMTTNRLAPLGDQLNARFSAQSYGGRVEVGYRYAVMPAVGITPYAALQAQSFYTPTYTEIDPTGGGFGLTYSGRSATDTRSELGVRSESLTMLGNMPLSLRARVAWAHDWVSDPSLSAVFQALPGASFVVNGAAMPHDSALASMGAELRMSPNWSLAAKFNGEFAARAQTYAGTGTLRYTW